MASFHCYQCGREKAYSSRARNPLERWILPVFLLRPVRCDDCFRRQYVTVFCTVHDRLHRSLDQPPPPPPKQIAA